jgi:peptide chain release factor
MPISPEKEDALRRKMEALGIFERDIEERFVRSSGAGGQHVNKTSTCVQLFHRPTGMQVKCQQDRSQSVNRFLARRLLLERIETERLGKQSEARQKIEKIRRQKRRRSRRSKEKMLANKKHRSGVLQNRKISWD